MIRSWVKDGRGRGKVAAAGTLAAVLAGAVPAASGTPGDLDPGFGAAAHGRVLFDLGSVTGIAVQPGGGIVTVGYAGGGSADAVAARFHADGTRDRGFGTVTLRTPVDATELATAVTAQPDGKIVVTGTVTDTSGNNDFGVWRLTSSGVLDPSFGNGGFVQLGDPSHGDDAFDVAVDPHGRIVVAGSRADTEADIAVVRLTPSGGLDSTFNDGSPSLVLSNPGNDVARAVAVQPDGKIVLAGTYVGAVGNAVLRITPGTSNTPAVLDDSFGAPVKGQVGDGIADVPGTTNDPFNTDVAVTQDGHILVLDREPSIPPTGALDSTVVRLTDTGQVDISFGSATGARVAVPTLSRSPARSLAVLPHGGVAVSGSEGDDLSFVAKFHGDGRPDTAMGPTGVKTLGTEEDLTAVAALADGRIVAAGNVSTAAALPNVVYRLKGDLQAPSCGGKRATIVGTHAADRLVGTPGPDVITGLGGADTITGLGRGDIICGGRGPDRLFGGPGRDHLYGGPGHDILRGGPGHDTLTQ